jgi:hypothetical protein
MASTYLRQSTPPSASLTHCSRNKVFVFGLRNRFRCQHSFCERMRLNVSTTPKMSHLRRHPSFQLQVSRYKYRKNRFILQMRIQSAAWRDRDARGTLASFPAFAFQDHKRMTFRWKTCGHILRSFAPMLLNVFRSAERQPTRRNASCSPNWPNTLRCWPPKSSAPLRANSKVNDRAARVGGLFHCGLPSRQKMLTSARWHCRERHGDGCEQQLCRFPARAAPGPEPRREHAVRASMTRGVRGEGQLFQIHLAREIAPCAAGANSRSAQTPA